MQTSSIAVSVVVSCLLNTVLDFFKNKANECNLPETNKSRPYDFNNLALHIRNHEKWVSKTLQGNITALETKLITTRETTLGECQKVTEYLQTNKSQMLALQETQRAQQRHLADQDNNLHVKDEIIAVMEKKLEKMEFELVKYRNSLDDRADATDTSRSLTQQLVHQSQAFLPITVFLLTVGEIVLFLLMFLSRRATPTSPDQQVTPSTRRRYKPNRARMDK